MQPSKNENTASACLVCNTDGDILYSTISDYSGSIDGQWVGMQCPDCKSYWISPKPLKSKLHEFYENVDYYTHIENDYNLYMPILGAYQNYLSIGYLNKRYGYFEKIGGIQRTLGYLSSLRLNWKAWEDYKVIYLPFRKQGKVLEVGCGNGAVLKKLVDLGWDATGCDIDAKAVEVAKARGVNAVHSDIESLSFDEGSFDAVGSCHVIEHVHDPEVFLKECYRILKPGGELRIITPNVEALSHKLTKQCWMHLHIPWHLSIFSQSGLRKIAARCGFREIEITSSIRDSNNAFKLSIKQKEEGNNLQKVRWSQGKRGKFLGKFFQLYLVFRLIFNRALGDELILKAVK